MYTIHFSDSRADVECNSFRESMRVLVDEIGPDYAMSDAAEQCGAMDECGNQPMRRLVWASEAESENDGGENAVASVRWNE